MRRPRQSSSSRSLAVLADGPHAERDAAGLALGAQLHLRARALDVGLQVAAHGFRRAHLDAAAVVLRHANGPDDVLDDDDERLTGAYRDRLRRARASRRRPRGMPRARAGRPRPCLLPRFKIAPRIVSLLQMSVFAGALSAPTSFKAISKYSRTVGIELGAPENAAHRFDDRGRAPTASSASVIATCKAAILAARARRRARR